MQFVSNKKLYLPAFSIIAVISILFFLISISTYRNLDREKNKILLSFHRQALTILRALEAGVRTGRFVHNWQEDMVVTLINEVAKNDDISYIYLFDSSGRIVHHTDNSKKGGRTTWKPSTFEKGWVHSRINQSQKGLRTYEIARFFAPKQPARIKTRQDVKPRSQVGASHLHTGDFIVLGLKMDTYEVARKADLHHAVIMAIIVFMLGSGTIFFIFVIQNYYLVEKTLKHTQDYSKQVVSSMASGLISIDRKGKIVSYNQTALGLLDLKEDSIRDAKIDFLLDIDKIGLHDVLNDNRTISDREFKYQKHTGGVIPLSISVSPICSDNGECNGAVLIFRDLRKIKQLESRVRRSEKLASVGQLAAGIAHEIRNPMSSIRGFAQFLMHALKEKPKEKEYAGIMIKEIDRINRIVTDLLTFASPKEAILEPTNVNELINHVIHLVESDVQSKNISIIFRNDPDLKDFPLDAYQITQALLNLLINSIKFSDEGGKILIDASLNQKGSILVIQVEDDGPGISKENILKIFDPFFTTRETGTGLGLAIVHKIIENHSGEIDVLSPPPDKSKGCLFIFRIPIGTKS
jgi:two-component system sensor histidine kinase HydH